MIDDWLIDDWLTDDGLMIDDSMMIDWQLIDDWLMISGMALSQFNCDLLYWIVELDFQILLKEFGTDCLGLVY